MSIQRLLAGLVQLSQRNARAVVAAGALLVALGLFVAAGRLGVSTDTNLMFSESLPWRHNQIVFNKDFPQFTELLVAVIDARIPEEAEATAAALSQSLSGDREHFVEVRRPDSSPYFEQEGLLLLDQTQLTAVIDRIVAAQPFLAQLATDPSARGLFTSLSLIGTGIQRGQGDISAFLPALEEFHRTMQGALNGKPAPMSWARLLGGELSDLGGKYKFVLFRVNPQFGALEPGGAATTAIRAAAARLPFVSAGEAHMRITGPVALADDEFSTVAQGAVAGLLASIVLITLWLFLAVRTWRLILPILCTLAIGLVCTLLFAALAVGTLNLVSVGFGILFVGIAVDFAIQFAVRYREVRQRLANDEALRETGRRVGRQILVAAGATAAGFLAFVPTEFEGVAELGLIAGVGMIIAFACTMIFLPALIVLFNPKGDGAEVGFRHGAALDAFVCVWRRPIVIGFAALAVLAVILAPRLSFDANPLHTKDPTTEAMRTLSDLIASPITNPFTSDVLAPNIADAQVLSDRLSKLSMVSGVVSINSFVPRDQPEKLPLIEDAAMLLGPSLAVTPAIAPPTAEEVRTAAAAALAQIEPALPKVASDHPLAAIAADLRRLSSATDAAALATNRVLTEFLPVQLRQLRDLLSARPVTVSDVPPEIARDWVLPDGRARIQVLPKPSLSTADLRPFVNEVRSVAPNAGGSAVIILETSNTIVGAFRSAALTALAAITVILFVTLWRVLDVGLVLAPLLLSALLTVLVAVSAPIALNFANIIALPLLLGVGVSFNIYFVMNWRAGQKAVLASATARAILFSALTTGTAFCSLALSRHPGTASMGTLLLVSLACTLVASLAFIPALLACLKRPESAPVATGSAG